MKRLIILAISSLLAIGASAQVTFIGVSGGDWNVATNWSSLSVPNATTSVEIPALITVIVNDPSVCSKLSLNVFSKLSLQGANGNLTINGPIDTDDASITFGSSSNFITIRGDISQFGITQMEVEGGITLYSWPDLPVVPQ